MLKTYKNKKIEYYRQVGEPSKGWTYEHITPTGEVFHVVGKGCNYNGNPSYNIIFDNQEIFKKIAKVPAAKRGVRVLSATSCISFTSYNVGETLKHLCHTCELEKLLGLE